MSAVASPTSRIPSAYKNLGNVVCFALLRASITFCADLGPIRSKIVSSPALNRNKSAGVLTISRSTSCSITLSPKPSTSMALRETKCFNASLR
ncbi:Uncharacterised protein [Vibrio cholerae]|nr:Uncharacterised protein [Vibrio cholerae]